MLQHVGQHVASHNLALRQYDTAKTTAEFSQSVPEVKNTFLDDVVREQSSNESTLAEAQTCPEFRSRNDALSSSSASISGGATASATQSELCLGDPELMHTLQSLPNTLQTMSPPCSLRYQVAEVPACEADFTDVTPPNTMPMTLELWPDQMSHEVQLLSALPSVPNAPFGHLLNAPSAQSPPRIHDALGANLSAMAAAAAFPSVLPMPNVPSVPWAPPVLSTIPPANEILAQVSCQNLSESLFASHGGCVIGAWMILDALARQGKPGDYEKPEQYRHDKLCNVVRIIVRIILSYSKAEPAVRSLAYLHKGSRD